MRAINLWYKSQLRFASLNQRRLGGDCLACEIKIVKPLQKMNADDSAKTGETVIHVPFWVAVLVSGFLLMAGYAIYCYLTAGISY
jgi:hypothetical protein